MEDCSYRCQAWYLTEATEAIASVAPGLCLGAPGLCLGAPGLCLGALSKVPTEIYKFLIEVPFAKEKSPCPFKYEVSGLRCSCSCEDNEHLITSLK